MKRLAKWLAIFAFVIILGAVWKSIITTRAEDPNVCAPNGTMKILGPACGPQANIHPDINIKLRGFEKTDGTMNVIDLGSLSTDVDPKHPNIDTLFDDPLKHAIVGLYNVGVWEGKNTGIYTDWVHLVGFSVFPTDNIKVPTSGYDLGCGFEVMVLFADENSITIKYTLDDNMVSGYGIHILGIKVREDIVAKYKAADLAGRKELPVLRAGEIMGQPAEAAIWVSVRDTGAFLDPRSCQDFWTNCSFVNRLPQATTWNLPPEYDQSSATRGAKTPACDISGFQKQAYYPPLGSLQECPVEFPTTGTISLQAQKTNEPVNLPNGFYCGIKPIPEPAMCKNPPKEGDPGRDSFCQGPSYMRWCRYETGSCNLIQDRRAACDASGQNINNCATYYKFCTDEGEGNWKTRLEKAHTSSQGCSLLNDDDRDTIGRCLDFLKINTDSGTAGGLQPPPGAFPSLPVCVPTANRAQPGRCTSACGDKLTITESLGFNIQNNCATGTCKATIQIDPKTPLYAPLAKDLSDYFAGVMDAGSVAEGTLTETRLRELQLALMKRPVTNDDYATLSAVFNKAGVARKLLPLEVQDQLKCQFIKYVKNKIDSKQNTKYRYLVDGKETFFQIGGVSVRDYVLPPKFDQDFKKYDPIDMNVGCAIKQKVDIEDQRGWELLASAKAWIDVPLFDNDESQGKIEFVSGGVFTNELNPIQTSIPEIRRLNSATNVVQEALMPHELSLPPDERPAAITPQSRFLTIGPEIRPKLVLNACTKTQTLKDLYEAYDALQAKNAADNDPKTTSQIYYPEPETPSYVLGVECLQNGGNLPKDLGSLSKVCSVGPEGQINCFQQLPAAEIAGTNGRRDFSDVTVQTRNVTPDLYDTYLQTIDQSRGVLRIFQPYAVQIAGNNKLDQFRANEEFERNFVPLPAESNRIRYLMKDNTGVNLVEKTDGWKLLFDKLGGVYTAKEFILKLLNPGR